MKNLIRHRQPAQLSKFIFQEKPHHEETTPEPVESIKEEASGQETNKTPETANEAAERIAKEGFNDAVIKLSKTKHDHLDQKGTKNNYTVSFESFGGVLPTKNNESSVDIKTENKVRFLNLSGTIILNITEKNTFEEGVKIKENSEEAQGFKKERNLIYIQKVRGSDTITLIQNLKGERQNPKYPENIIRMEKVYLSMIEFKGETYIKNDGKENDDGSILNLVSDSDLLNNGFAKLTKENATKLKTKVYMSAALKVEKVSSRQKGASNLITKDKKNAVEKTMDTFLEDWDTNTKKDKE